LADQVFAHVPEGHALLDRQQLRVMLQDVFVNRVSVVVRAESSLDETVDKLVSLACLLHLHLGAFRASLHLLPLALQRSHVTRHVYHSAVMLPENSGPQASRDDDVFIGIGLLCATEFGLELIPFGLRRCRQDLLRALAQPKELRFRTLVSVGPSAVG
jgi:hypothetical protein